MCVYLSLSLFLSISLSIYIYIYIYIYMCNYISSSDVGRLTEATCFELKTIFKQTSAQMSWMYSDSDELDVFV